MLVVHATKKLRHRLKGAPAATSETSTGLLGSWYATALFWRPQVALFVNEATLLPVLVPLAPASSLIDRFRSALGEILTAQGAGTDLVAAELAEMNEWRLAKTANRSVVGIMNEFTYLGEVFSQGAQSDLRALSIRLATVPCGPLYKSQGSPGRELQALLAGVGTRDLRGAPKSTQ